jgi:hypothetical protein
MTDDLRGRWRVVRTSGLLPPFGLHKRIGEGTGWTEVGPVPVAHFRIRGRTLDYTASPLRDELTPGEKGEWLGRGLFFGREFCRFRLVREPEG